MAEQILSRFFERYPSAMGSSRAGGYYRVICPACGEMVQVAAPDAPPYVIDMRCADCGREDRLGEEPAAAVAD